MKVILNDTGLQACCHFSRSRLSDFTLCSSASLSLPCTQHQAAPSSAYLNMNSNHQHQKAIKAASTKINLM